MALKTSLGGELLSESMNVMDWPSLAIGRGQQFFESALSAISTSVYIEFAIDSG